MKTLVQQHDGVLLVEDNPLIAMDIEDRLAQLGFVEIHTAANLTTASEHLQARHIRLAVLDVNVGNDLVFPLAAELREAGIPFVFCTAQSPECFPCEWKSYPILPKPFEARRFLQVLKDPDFGGGN